MLREQIAEILLRELKDSRLGFVTITDSEVTRDLRHAKVFVSILGSEQDRQQNMAILKKAEKFIRVALSRRLSMKVLPEIHFELDTSVDRGVRIFELLEQIKRDDEEKPT